MAKDILVIGGSNIDIKATSLSDLVLHDSNIGSFTLSHGGVSRNVVENLLRLRDDVLFLTALGREEEAAAMQRELAELGGKVLVLRDDRPTARYIAIHDKDGDLYVAVCDSEILDTLRPEHFLPFDETIQAHEFIAVDTNLSKEALDFLFERYSGHRFLVEGVSANKIVRLADHLPDIALLKCNRMEAKVLLGADLPSAELALELSRRGLFSAVITDGDRDVTILEAGKVSSLPVVKAEHVVSTMGCGDALFAGLLHGLHLRWSLPRAVFFGIEMSSATLSSPYAVDSDIAEKVLKK